MLQGGLLSTEPDNEFPIGSLCCGLVLAVPQIHRGGDCTHPFGDVTLVIMTCSIQEKKM